MQISDRRIIDSLTLSHIPDVCRIADIFAPFADKEFPRYEQVEL